MVKIAPSLLSANFSRLGEDVSAIDEAGADWMHLDVMDGHFVPNLTFGPPVIRDLRTLTDKVFDAHLMVSNPDALLDDYIGVGCDSITVHQEATPHLHRTLQRIRKARCKAGVSLNPATSPETIKYVLEEIDLVLVMSVNPGFGGQTFIPSQLDKIRTLKRWISEKNLPVLIQVDGGVTSDNARQIIDAGADVLVAGSAIFKDIHYAQNIAALRQP